MGGPVPVGGTFEAMPVRCGAVCVCVCVCACVPCLCTNDAAKPRPHGNAAGYSVKLIREKQDISSATVFSLSELE